MSERPNQGADMSEVQPWLGMCHLTKQEGETQESYQAIAAVFCADRETYDKLLHKFLKPKGYRLLWSEEVHPAGQWISRFPQDRSAAGLARAVHPQHLIEIGTLRAAGKEGEDEVDENEYLNIVEHELEGADNYLPWISLPLKQLLFDDPQTENTRTYAILDAAVWKNNGRDLRSELEDSDLRWRCLYKGEAEEENKGAAPYLVDISWEHFNPDSPLAFHKILFEKFWETNTGVFFRTDVPMDEVWASLRKFTRIRDVDEKWFYLRFWEPEYFLYFFTFMKNTAMIRSLDKIPLFVMQIAGSAVSIEPDFAKLTVLQEDYEEQVDLIFNASTAMVAFRHIRELEKNYQGQIDEETVFEEFENLFGGAGMDYDDMKKLIEILYILRFYYKDEWSHRLTRENIEKFFNEDGDIDSFMWLIHGQCNFAIENGVYPHELNLNRGIR